jgi:hypothetical protein
MLIYKSKIGIGIVIFIALILGLSSYLMIKDRVWIGLIINVLVAVFIAYIFLQTYYTIDKGILRVKCAFLINKSFEISRVTEVRETNNPISAPATSLDRLEIVFDNYESVIISPKQKNDFILQLRKLNPKIIVYLKK